MADNMRENLGGTKAGVNEIAVFFSEVRQAFTAFTPHGVAVAERLIHTPQSNAGVRVEF